MKAKPTSNWLMLAVLAGISACGQPAESQFVNLALSLETRDIPENTEEIHYYILPNIVTIDGEEVSLDCGTFLLPDAVSVFDYSDFFVRRDMAEVDQALSRIDIPIFKLPVGRHLFYIVALGSGSGDPLACGCNEGQIEAGEKVQVRIRMVLDCY